MHKFGVCMITTHYYPHIGGAEKQIELLGQWLVREGRQVTVVTRQMPGIPNYEVHNGVEVFRVPTPDNKILAAMSFTLLGLWTLIRQRKQYDVIHSHQVFSPTTIGWLASKLLGKPLIINLHRGGQLGDLDKLLRNERVGRWRFNTLRADSEAFIAISDEIYDELRAEGVPKEHIHFMPNSVNTDVFHPVTTAEQQAMRQKLGIPLDKPVVVYIGRLVPEKGIDLLLDAWAAVQSQAHLLIIGKGELDGMIRERVQKDYVGSVEVLGPKTNVVEYLQAADIWTLPSRTEGLPLSLLEAMACGLPVVASRVGGIPDVVKDGVNGLLIPPEDTVALADRLQHAVKLDESVQELGRRAVETVRESFDTEVSAKKYDQLYQNVLG